MAADVRDSIAQWSATEGSNLPVGSTTVGTNMDDNLRMVQAVVRKQAQDDPWLDWGHAPTFLTSTSFSVPGNLTALYEVNRRVRLFGSTMGTLTGAVTASTFSTVTTVTVALDSGALTANLSQVLLSKVTPSALPANAANDALLVHKAGAETITGPKTFSAQPIGITAASVVNVPAGSISATNMQAAIAEIDADIQLRAPLASPIFSGNPRAPTAAAGTNNTDLATTAFVQAAVTGGSSGFATVAQVQNNLTHVSASVGGGVNAFTLSLTPAPTAYAVGMEIHWITTGSNTAAVTVNVNGLGAVALTKYGTQQLVAGDLQVGKLHIAVFDGTRFQLQNPPSSTAADGTSFTPVGSIAATNVQSAIAEMEAEKAPIATAVTTNTVQTITAAKTFTAPVSGGNAVSAGQFVTKGQIDNKLFAGRVTSAGTATAISSGMSITKQSTGRFLISHAIGTANYGVSAVAVDPPFQVRTRIESITSTSFIVQINNPSDGLAADSGFSFTAIAI